MRTVLGLMIVALVAGPSHGLLAASEPAVTVDAGRPLGPVPFLFRAGGFVNDYPLAAPFDIFVNELKPGAVHLMPLREGSDIGSLAEYRKRLPTFSSSRAAIKVAKRGGRPVIALTEVPKWLRQNQRDGYLRPPRDMAGWSDFVEAHVRFFNNERRLDAEYILWDEPDLKAFWKDATNEDYFALYRAFVLGARRANPKAKVGGPAVSWWGAPGQGGDGKRPMLYQFIRYCAQTPLPDVGLARLPIDVLVWHQFATDPKGDPLLYATAGETVRSWLTEFGYQGVTLSNGSWNTWVNFGKDGNELSSERDTEYAAAYIVHTLDAMHRAGIAEHTFFSVTEDWQWKSLPPARRDKEFAGREFFGGFGLLTQHGVIKPAFNAFKALGALEGHRVQVTVDDPYLTAIASRSGETVSVVLSSFVWPQEGRTALKGRMLLAKGHTRAEMAAWALTPQMVQDLDVGRRTIESLAIPPSAKQALSGLSALDVVYESRMAPRSVRLRVALPQSGVVRIQRYVIDERHAGGPRTQAFIEQAGKQAQSDAQLAAADLLQQWGLLTEGFRSWDKQRQVKQIQAVVPRLSPPQREAVAQAVQATERRALDQINRHPEIALPRVEDTQMTAQPGTPLELVIPVPAYSVHLVTLTPAADSKPAPGALR